MIKFYQIYRGVPRDMRKLLRQIIKEEMKKMLIDWRENILPGHFEAGAGQKYKYRKRTEKYYRRKLRRGRPPLVFTGRSKQMILADKKEPTGTSKTATLTLRVPWYFDIDRSFQGWGDHRLGDEVLKITKEEEKMMTDELTERIVKRINANQYYQKMLLAG